MSGIADRVIIFWASPTDERKGCAFPTPA